MKSRLGFIGIGVMGLPMAGHLARAGYALTAFDINPVRLAALTARHHGVHIATSARELAAACDVVFTMLPDGQHVQQVALGVDGLLEGFASGALLIDTSSCEPWLTRETAQALSARGVGMVDAATSGAEMGAKAAELVFMIGGADDDVNRAREFLDIVGKQAFHLGPSGSGHTMKSINNLITAMTLVATAEGMVVGKKLGLDPNAMTDVLNACTGMSWISKAHLRQRITNRAFDDAFRLALVRKDIGIALGLAQDAQLELPLSEAGGSIYAQADEQAGEGASLSEVVRWIEGNTGVTIEPASEPTSEPDTEPTND